MQKKKKTRRRGGEKVSHVLCQFADGSFDCYRLIGAMWWLTKILFCRAQKEDEEAPSKCNMLILLQVLIIM